MTATLSTEDALNAALDAEPANHLLRYALADCLEESAGAVACGRCDGLGLYARQRGLLNFDPIECPNCSGTGRVSDGRRERAERAKVEVYGHPDCIFHYCPHPAVCRSGCISPTHRG